MIRVGTEAVQHKCKGFGIRHLDSRLGFIRYYFCDSGKVSSLSRAFVFISVKWEL